MKGFLNRRDVVVPRREAKDVEPVELRPLALQLGEFQATVNKLLYRIQQLERREKSLRTTVSSLRRELTVVRKAASSTPEAVSVTASARVPEAPRVSPPKRMSYSDASPNFGSALDELN